MSYNKQSIFKGGLNWKEQDNLVHKNNQSNENYQTALGYLLRTNTGNVINNYTNNNINTNDDTHTNDDRNIMYDSSGQPLPTSRTLSHSTTTQFNK